MYEYLIRVLEPDLKNPDMSISKHVKNELELIDKNYTQLNENTFIITCDIPRSSTIYFKLRCCKRDSSKILVSMCTSTIGNNDII